MLKSPEGWLFLHRVNKRPNWRGVRRSTWLATSTTCCCSYVAREKKKTWWKLEVQLHSTHSLVTSTSSTCTSSPSSCCFVLRHLCCCQCVWKKKLFFKLKFHLGLGTIPRRKKNFSFRTSHHTTHPTASPTIVTINNHHSLLKGKTTNRIFSFFYLLLLCWLRSFASAVLQVIDIYWFCANLVSNG
jgi:hypothetical protein